MVERRVRVEEKENRRDEQNRVYFLWFCFCWCLVLFYIIMSQVSFSCLIGFDLDKDIAVDLFLIGSLDRMELWRKDTHLHSSVEEREAKICVMLELFIQNLDTTAFSIWTFYNANKGGCPNVLHI